MTNTSVLHILATGSSKCRFLVTPEGSKHLQNIDILEITDRHDCLSVKRIATKEIDMKVGLHKTSLFDYMYDLKSMLNCKFEFAFNSKKLEVVIAFFLPSGYLLSLVVIQ